MKSKHVKRTLDLKSSPSLTAKQQATLAVLAKRPGDAIACGDIPPLTDTFWKNAVCNPLYKPTKQTTTVRVDSDVLLWLKGQGKGYQTRMNAILREAMLRNISHKA